MNTRMILPDKTDKISFSHRKSGPQQKRGRTRVFKLPDFKGQNFDFEPSVSLVGFWGLHCDEKYGLISLA